MSKLSKFVRDICHITEEEEVNENPFKIFYDFRFKRTESQNEWKARMILWEWMGRSLYGDPRGKPSKCYYLFLTGSKYDCGKLYRELCRVIEVPNIKSHGELLKKFQLIKIEDSEDIQMFFYRLDTARKHIESINEFCDKTMRIEIPNWQIRAKLIEAAESIPKFKHYIDQLMLKEPREWSNMTHTEILHGLRVAETNSMISEPTPEKKNSVVSKGTTVPGKV